VKFDIATRRLTWQRDCNCSDGKSISVTQSMTLPVCWQARAGTQRCMPTCGVQTFNIVIPQPTDRGCGLYICRSADRACQKVSRLRGVCLRL